MAEPTLFDAISTAIESDGENLGGPNAASDDSAVAGDTGADDAGLSTQGDDQDAPAGGEGDDPSGELGGEDAEGGEREGEGADGQTRGPDGKFLKKGEGDKPGEKPGEQKPGQKAPDHVNDPIPKDLKPATQERMRFLVNETKKLDGELKQTRGDFEQLVTGIRSTGTTPEQYGEVLSFMALFNSGDTAQQGKALELLEDMADRLATHLGKERTVGDPLAAHADLKADVQAGKISLPYAKELARTRNQAKFRGDIEANQRKDLETRQQHETAVEEARVGLNTLEETLESTDPQYKAIKAQILPVLKAVLPSLPPAQWAAKFKEAYRNAKARMTVQRPRAPGNQPMRGGRAAGGGGAGTGADGMSSGGPATMFDAINSAIARAGK